MTPSPHHLLSSRAARRWPRSISAFGLIGLAACASPGAGPRSAGAQAPGAARSPVSPRALDQVDSSPSLPAPPTPSPAAALRLPDQLALPAAYRLLLLDGRLALVRETDPQALQSSSPSLRIVAGELARGELAYQPALLPQEVAAELAGDRQSAARMDQALQSVMERSRRLAEQARAIEEQSRRLTALLASAESRVAELEKAQKNPP